ncbi:hypothetical protein BEP19_12600 [Ammoniphilus oxalaticus]|uniref:C2H2-type domain-containing protein n=1 Tax=Ammoniphilus oxalaticus TaxID=66863 RepID=A0A419SGZ8_9BACL|nr:IS1 family transposase [Ammoniphilus oxalaticus]RKD23059.1 hypothetical protein BEP19_12600 [Ammoniphilus oxalaticus]
MKKRTMFFRRFSTPEIYLQLIKTLSNQGSARHCPNCKSNHVIGHGQYRERKRYKCKSCNRTFNDLTSTPLHYTHHPYKFVEFLFCMIRGYSLHNCAVCAGIHYVTAFYWRHKALHALQQIEKDFFYQYTRENLRDRWSSPYITFKDVVPFRLVDLTQEEEKEFQEWMRFRNWIKVKYLSRYLAWFRFARNQVYLVRYVQIENLFLLLCSIPIVQTYQTIKQAC